MSVRSRQSSDFKRVSNLTHFIRIPLLNQSSSSQIQKTLWQVANDSVSATVPPLAYQPLQRLRLTVSPLSLPTQEDKEHAISLLQDLGKQDWQKLFLKAQVAPFNAQDSSTLDAERPSNGHANQLGPRSLVSQAMFREYRARNASQFNFVTRMVCLKEAMLTPNWQVDLVGLGESLFRQTPSDLKNKICLYTFIKEPTGVLNSFCRALSQEFSAAGLERRDPIENDVQLPRFRQTRAVETKGLRSGIPRTKPPVKHRKFDIAPRFDARGICEKFKDVVWAKDVHLDRVCISEMGKEPVKEDGQTIGFNYRDIVSIPLPGVTWEPRSFEYLRLPHRWATAETQGRDRA